MTDFSWLHAPYGAMAHGLKRKTKKALARLHVANSISFRGTLDSVSRIHHTYNTLMKGY